MRRHLAIALALLLGIILGGVATNHVWVVSAKALHEASLAQFISEQEFLAFRANSENDSLREVIHRINVADAQAEHGFRWLQRGRNASYLEWAQLPWSLYWILQTTAFSPNDPRLERGRKILEAQYRARAAIALENFGATELAEQQWVVALRLQPARTKEENRKFLGLGAPSALEQRLATAYLDSSTGSELDSALTEIRKSMGEE